MDGSSNERKYPGAAVVVDNNREPRLCDVAVGTDQQNIERRVVSLPDGIRPVGFTPMNQFKGLAVRFAALMGKGEQIGGPVADDAITTQ